jgi:hypothetical protein
MNRINKIVFFLIAVGMYVSCIRSYEPDILTEDEKKYVISGYVTDEQGLQTVNITITSPIHDPKYIPAQGCLVNIIDEHGNSFPMQDNGDGNYTNSLDLAFLKTGTAYKLEVTTPEGDFITSDFDTLPHGPPVDSVYYVRDEKLYNPAAPPVSGIQFYVDLKAAPTDSRYFKWDVIETWEYHAVYPLEWYYNGVVNHVSPPDYSRMICWRTLKIPDIYTLTTENLTENSYAQFPLHFVNNLTTKLAYGYSLLVRQFALSQEAFVYFENLNINSNPEGGLYNKQPLAIQGNFHNITHPDKDVLGFFAATASRSKRIFVYPIPDLPLMYDSLCDPTPLRNGLKVIKPKDYPAYLYGNSEGWSPIWMENECVDCTTLGGTIIKPSFWPF